MENNLFIQLVSILSAQCIYLLQARHCNDLQTVPASVFLEAKVGSFCDMMAKFCNTDLRRRLGELLSEMFTLHATTNSVISTVI